MKNRMKRFGKFKRVILRAGMVLSTMLIAILSYGQLPVMVYTQADYMKVAPTKVQEYLELEQKTWKPIHEKRVKDGSILGWYLYLVRFQGTQSDYNYVTVTVYKEFANLEQPFSDNLVAQVYPDMSTAKLTEKTESIREMIKSDVAYRIAAIRPEGATKPSKFLEMDFMKTKLGQGNTYVQMEQQIWAPIHKERTNSGLIAGWDLYGLVFNWGTSGEYNYGTIQHFNEFKNIEISNAADLIKEVHPEKDMMNLLTESAEIRDHVKHELWQLVDYVEAQEAD